MRYALGLQYHGKHYAGWQRQREVASVQYCVESALTFVANEPISVHCAGRTDAGVHATAQVVHFDTTAVRAEQAWLNGVNARLPMDIKVIWVQAVPESFHARFSALSRHYQYVLYRQRFNSALFSEMCAWVPQTLDLSAMTQAAQDLPGEQDFSGFRASGCQSHSPWRNIHHTAFHYKPPFLFFEISANAFLHHMVRNIVGSLLLVGQKRQNVSYIRELIAGKDRRAAGKTAPACGLYLTGVDYPGAYNLPRPTGISDLLGGMTAAVTE